jgi:ribosomal protein S6
MRNLADEIEFNDDGSTVIMHFNLENELLKEVQKEKEKEV